MKQIHEYCLPDSLPEDFKKLKDFEAHMKEKSKYKKNSFDKVYNYSITNIGQSMSIEITVETDKDYDLIHNATKGGLGKALGKGRVI